MKCSYKITGLDCANCAKKLEDALNKNPDFSNVVINFITSKVTYETSISNSFSQMNKLIGKIEPGAKLIIDEEKKEYHLNILFLAIVLGLLGCFTTFKFHEIFIYVSYLLLLYNPFIKAMKMLLKSHTINENLLIVISCCGALIVGSKLEGMMVAALYLLGKILEEKALHKTRKSISLLVGLKQDYANLKIGNTLKKIDVSKVKVGDILCIKKGEKVPVDGVLTDGETFFDTSALTGESEPFEAVVDTKVLSGFINTKEIVSMKATSIFEDSTVSRILELVENASDSKAKVETTVSKLSKIYTPTVLLLAILVAVFLPFVFDVSYHESIYRGLTFLVISCPCAIAISVPLSYFVGIGVASLNGILIKGSNYLDNLRQIKKIIFDKTGTLTTGSFVVSKIEIIDKKYSKEEIIEILRAGESFSNHPIAKSIMKLSDQKIDNSEVFHYKEIDGAGISFEYQSHLVKIGNKSICLDSCDFDVSLHLNIDSKHVASVFIQDGLKENASLVIEELQKLGIKTYMFTGDKKEVANYIAKKLKIDEVYASMLPDDKYLKYEELEKEGQIVAFVGDGINDSPVIKRAAIGISMGSLGSDVAIEASDVVIMNDDLEKIVHGIQISRYTNLIIKENLIVALSVKFLILLLSIFGVASMWFAVFADTGLTLLTILNSLRIMIKFKKKNGN